MAMDVADWLRGLGFERYAAAFADNDIDDLVLRRLTADDLRELGVSSIGHRRRLLDEIAALSPTAVEEIRTTVAKQAELNQRRKASIDRIVL